MTPSDDGLSPVPDERTVPVVDDEEDLREALSDLLGVSVDATRVLIGGSAAEALRVLVDEPVDIGAVRPPFPPFLRF